MKLKLIFLILSSQISFAAMGATRNLVSCKNYQRKDSDRSLTEDFGRFGSIQYFYSPAVNPDLMDSETISDRDKAWFNRVCQPEIRISFEAKGETNREKWRNFTDTLRRAPTDVRALGTLFRELLLVEQTYWALLYRNQGFVGSDPYRYAMNEALSYDEKSFEAATGAPHKDAWAEVEFHYLKILNRLGYGEGETFVHEVSASRTENVSTMIQQGQIRSAGLDQLSDIIYGLVPATRETIERTGRMGSRFLKFEPSFENSSLNFLSQVKFTETTRQTQFFLKRKHINSFLSFGNKVFLEPQYSKSLDAVIYTRQALPALFLRDLESHIRLQLAKMRPQDRRALLVLYQASLAASQVARFSPLQDDVVEYRFFSFPSQFIGGLIQESDKEYGIVGANIGMK